MWKPEKDSDSTVNYFHLSDRFPDAVRLLQTELSPVEESKESAIFVLDTNVLLMPYSTKSSALDQILKTYAMLVEQRRLIVPAQVLREFVKNRPEKLKELHQQLAAKKSQYKGIEQSPLLEALSDFKEVAATEKELREANRKFQEAVTKVLNKIRSWRWDDPVTVGYREHSNQL